MLRAIQQLPKTVGSGRLLCSAVTPARLNPLGYSRVILAGEIITEPMSIPNGVATFLLRTRDEANGKHAKGIAPGQHAHVIGTLFTEDFTTKTGKRRTPVGVRVNNKYFIKPTHQRLSSVELRGLVRMNSIETTDFTMFPVLTTHVSKSSGSLVAQHMPVFVYDKALRELIKEHALRYTIVNIVGQIGGRAELNKKGQKRYAGHIRANNILLAGSSHKVAHL